MATLLDKLKNAKNGTQIPDEIPQEMIDEFEQDPVPDPAPGPGRRIRTGRLRPAARNTALKRRLTPELEFYTTLAAGLLSSVDEVCGGALNEQSQAIAVALATLLSRYPDLAAKIVASGAMGDWIVLLRAILPVLTTVKNHHITRKVSSDQPAEDIDVNQYPAYRPGA